MSWTFIPAARHLAIQFRIIALQLHIISQQANSIHFQIIALSY